MAKLSLRRRDVDMTEGNILRHIVMFAFPLLVGNAFQQLYNMVDTWVVGNFVSDTAFSAVGTVGPIINTLIGFFTGLASGAGVVISQYYGAGRQDDVQDAVHTSVAMTLVLCLAFTVLGVCGTPLMLKLIKMPDSAMAEASAYLTIYFAGVTGLMIYNMGAGILRAVGDSARPFYFLAVCAVMNCVLDLLLVIVFHMGVAGVALATILSQGISALLITVTLLRTNSCVRVRIGRLRLHLRMLKKIFFVGIPAALQMAVTAFSNIFVQSYINHFQELCMGGWTAYSKVDQLLFLPMQSISLAVTTFVGQNLGKNQTERAQQGVRCGLLLAVGTTLMLMVPVLIFAPYIVYLFEKNPDIISYGTMFLRYLTPFYVTCCVNQVYAGALRGAGNSRAPMIIMLSSFVVFRQIYLFIMARVCNEILPIAMSYPAGWIVCSVLTWVYYHKVHLDSRRLVE